MENKIEISPSLMCLNLKTIREDIEFLNNQVDSYHVDIMDGHNVPNLALSPWFVEEINKMSKVPLSVHLMTVNPEFWIPKFIELRCEYIGFVAETAIGKAFRFIEEIHNAGLKSGVVLNPEVSVETIKPYISRLDKVTVMTVDPGFAGQKFLPICLDKIRELRELREKYGYKYKIEIDGSANKENYKKMHEANPDIYIVGNSGLFNLSDNIEKSWKIMVDQFKEETGVELN